VVIVRQGIIHAIPPARTGDLAAEPVASQNPAKARLRDLALALAAYSDLRVCVITYKDGSCELQILYAGPSRPAGTADATKFTGQARQTLSQIRSITDDSGLQAAADLIHATLREASASVT
jgi:hypothetical protein